MDLLPGTDPQVIDKYCYYPHPEVNQGQLYLNGNHIFVQNALIDLTGNIEINEYCMIGRDTQIFTHDHYHSGRKPLQQVQVEKGVKYQDKFIGKDVRLHGCIVLYQVTRIPNGVVVGAGSVLTRNPGEYEIWAGNPAVKVGVR